MYKCCQLYNAKYINVVNKYQMNKFKKDLKIALIKLNFFFLV